MFLFHCRFLLLPVRRYFWFEANYQIKSTCVQWVRFSARKVSRVFTWSFFQNTIWFIFLVILSSFIPSSHVTICYSVYTNVLYHWNFRPIENFKSFIACYIGITWLVLWLRKLAPTSQPITWKPKTNATWTLVSAVPPVSHASVWNFVLL